MTTAMGSNHTSAAPTNRLRQVSRPNTLDGLGPATPPRRIRHPGAAATAALAVVGLVLLVWRLA